ncbi:MAG: DEAD/DEAH box helicase [Verrucomicrobiales bacterium]
MSRIPFSELSLEPELLKAIERMGFETASPIQSESILPAGRPRLAGQSMTGSGKTAAFGVPVVQRVDAHRREIQALILCPTRELAAQVAEEIARLAFFKKGSGKFRFMAAPVMSVSSGRWMPVPRS